MALEVTDIDVSDDIEGAMLPGPTHPVKCLSDGERLIQEVVQLSLAVRVDEPSATLMYVGKAQPGTLTSAAGWQIQKLDTSIGTTIEWADGNANFDNVWDDRASLTYI